ncbi:MAG: hypothetical protein JRJ12_09385 [Deltaproteobacteria bacterium]|nr:hypothetical protein [Deltaproteobacteria bacterium]MBW2070583.1 hypothetical protein [Deltaproteobacteria bacterium]
MNKKVHSNLIILAALIFVCCGKAYAGELVTGEDARDRFEDYRKYSLDMFVDFESYEPGLYTELAGLGVTLHTTKFRWPLPVENAPEDTPVVILPYDFVTSPANHRLMGVRAGNIPDGQSQYVIDFEKCQKRVALERNWNTYALTRFIIPAGDLEYRNKKNNEFIGYIGDADEPGDCVWSIVIDGIEEDPDDENEDENFLYQVGEVDNLYFATPCVELTVEFQPNPNNATIPVVRSGETIKLKVKVKNLAPYSVEKLALRVEFVKYEYDFALSIGQEKDINVPAKQTFEKMFQFNFKRLPPRIYGLRVTLIERMLRVIHKVDQKFLLVYGNSPMIMELLLGLD